MIGEILDAISHGVIGILVFIALLVYRALSSGEWDSSNITNWFRVLVHLVLHPGDLAYMYYIMRIDGKIVSTRKPFWYVTKDEITQVVNTRPFPKERQ